MVSDKPVWQMGPQTRLAKDRQSELGREPGSSVQSSLSQLAFLSTLHCLKSRSASSAYQTSLQIWTALSSLTLAPKKKKKIPYSLLDLPSTKPQQGAAKPGSDSLVMVVYSHITAEQQTLVPLQYNHSLWHSCPICFETELPLLVH